MSAYSNSNWQGDVRRMILWDGLGVEDVALRLGCSAEHVRQEVSILREEGVLANFYARRAKGASV